jgi:hypothetical protein
MAPYRTTRRSAETVGRAQPLHVPKEEAGAPTTQGDHAHVRVSRNARRAVAPAGGQPDQDRLVNIAIGDVTIPEDTNIGVAARVAARYAASGVGPVTVLGRAVDRSGATQTVGESDQGPTTIEQDT